VSKTKRRRTQVSRKRQNSSSLVIPIVVGVVVIAIVVGVILSIEGGQSASAELAGEGLSAANTAQPLDTRLLPYPDVPRISVQDTQAMMAQGQAVLVDVRSKASYDQTHAAGAISIPEAEMPARLSELPRDQVIILYCT
jgi:hypothetical protein